MKTLVFASLSALTALFVMLKKPIAVMIFELIAFVVVFAGAVWMLIKKIAAKKELKAEIPVQPEV